LFPSKYIGGRGGKVEINGLNAGGKRKCFRCVVIKVVGSFMEKKSPSLIKKQLMGYARNILESR
jgi:hypothetical protein